MEDPNVICDMTKILEENTRQYLCDPGLKMDTFKKIQKLKIMRKNLK